MKSRSLANDYASLDDDPLRLCSEIKSVRSAVNANSAETCPVEAYRNGLRKKDLIVVAGVAHNATYMERRHIRHQPVNADTTPRSRTNTPPRKCGDLDGECLA